jgi:hypothetical protein
MPFYIELLAKLGHCCRNCLTLEMLTLLCAGQDCKTNTLSMLSIYLRTASMILPFLHLKHSYIAFKNKQYKKSKFCKFKERDFLIRAKEIM